MSDAAAPAKATREEKSQRHARSRTHHADDVMGVMKLSVDPTS